MCIFNTTLAAASNIFYHLVIEKSCQAIGRGQKDRTCLIDINTRKGVT